MAVVSSMKPPSAAITLPGWASGSVLSLGGVVDHLMYVDLAHGIYLLLLFFLRVGNAANVRTAEIETPGTGQ